MYCLRCGTQNNDDTNFCRHCNEPLTNSHYDQSRYSYNYSQTGDSKSTYSKPMSHEEYANYSYKYSNKKDHVPLKNNHEDQYSYSYNYSANKIISGDEKYIANYVGNKYLSIKNSKFSLPTLIFGPLYFIYRKLFLYAFVWIVVLIATGYYIPNYLELVYWCSTVFLSTKFTNIYLEKVEQRVDKLKHESLDLTSQEILDKCSKVGGTIKVISKMFSIVYVIIFFGIILATIILPEYIDNMIYENQEPNDNYAYNLTYDIPEGFQITYNSSYTKEYEYKNSTTNNHCKIGIHINRYVDDYASHENFLENSISIPKYNEITIHTIKNKPWRQITYINNNSTFYYYGYIHNNKGYLVNYNIISDTTGECSNKYNDFINSLYLS